MIPRGLFLVDTSALARAAHGDVRRVLSGWGTDGLLATCPTIDLEVLYSARSRPCSPNGPSTVPSASWTC